jgi:hypothetical protein
VQFKGNCIYGHATAAFNFTTYDMQRDCDNINVHSDKNTIMIYTPSTGTDHPWRYARVLGIHHATAWVEGDVQRHTFAFLWVRYLETDASFPFGPAVRRLERVRYVPWDEDNDQAFGFVDPAHVIRACYLAPAVHYGYDDNSLPPSFAHDIENKTDWRYFYVNMCVFIVFPVRHIAHARVLQLCRSRHVCTPHRSCRRRTRERLLHTSWAVLA